MITDEQFTSWLNNQDAIRCVLVEVTVGQAGGGNITRYLSTKPYVTGNLDTPANTAYVARITGGLNYTRSLNMSGDVSLSFGDLALTNIDGALDAWVDDYWINRPFAVYLGDPRWARSDFRLVFSGLTLGLNMQNRQTFNIQISDNTQRLNTPVSETVLGGSTSLANNLIPLTFGECHNVSPLVVDASINKYQIHLGPFERLIEVRDNGAPVSFVVEPTTGYFRLENQPYGTITCSVQGGLIPANFLISNDAFTDSTVWTYSNVVTALTGTAPYSGTISNGVTAAASGSCYQEMLYNGITANTAHTTSVFVKAGIATSVDFKTWGDSHVGLQGVHFDFTTGKGTLITDAPLLAHGGVTQHWGAEPVGNGWWRLWVCGTNSTDTTAKIINVTWPNGDGTQISGYLAGLQLEVGTFPTSYWNGAAQLGTAVYRNTVAELVRFLVTEYGDSRLQFANTELDIAGLVRFDLQNRQPVGIYLDSRANVLDVCTQLASSVGARVTVNRQNKLTLVKLNLPQATGGTTVTAADMQEKTLAITAMPTPVASVKLGYCKNWTVQSTLAGGLDQTSVQLFQQEFLTVTRTDSAAAANYFLFTDPVEEDTLLLVGYDAVTEANRRLNMFNVQRKELTYSAYYGLIFEELGAAQTLVHPRFGLSSGVTGQIVSIAIDLTSNHITFKVLI
jgi:hypothetical protein